MHTLLTRLGFRVIRQKGSHARYEHPDGRACTVPNHRRKDLSRGLIRKILRDIEMTPDQFREELDKL
jgi:predicted RNA binding protein YcfA (HicA-like mRNA interferase family)